MQFLRLQLQIDFQGQEKRTGVWKSAEKEAELTQTKRFCRAERENPATGERKAASTHTHTHAHVWTRTHAELRNKDELLTLHPSLAVWLQGELAQLIISDFPQHLNNPVLQHDINLADSCCTRTPTEAETHRDTTSPAPRMRSHSWEDATRRW